MPRLISTLVLALCLAASLIPASASADDRLDFDVSGGHFFSETNGSTLGARAGGFSISDANGIPFWTFFTQQGGTDVLGYPVSTRFMWNGYVCQATQRAILQWDPASGSVQLANVVDYLSTAGEDDWLYQHRLVPKAELPAQEIQQQGQPISFMMRAHYRFAWLYQDPPIFEHYFNTPNYYQVFGLPTSPIEDLGPYYAARFQRAVIYHWKIPVPWADDSGVSVGLVGDIYKELGLIPSLALKPETVTPNELLANLPQVATSPAAAAPTTTTISTNTGILPVSPAPAAPTSSITNAGNLPVLVGVATWYGSDFQGRLMSDGQPYDMNNPATTASNAYPLGTWVKVTRLSTGSSIIVQVTDRGAFQYPDIVDLSYAAFSDLASPSTGVIRVRVEPVNGPS
jgi:hypothetical protein